jgi:hypothetical protein
MGTVFGCSVAARIDSGYPLRESDAQRTLISDPEDVGVMNWSGSDDLKGITGVSGNQFTTGSTVIVVRQIIVVVVFQFQVQMPTR